jgi:hypothetical protein
MRLAEVPVCSSGAENQRAGFLTPAAEAAAAMAFSP